MKRVTRSSNLLLWSSVALLILALGLVVGRGVRTLVTPAGSGGPRLVRIAPGQSVPEVASMLWQLGLIQDDRALVAAAYLTGKWRRIQAGRHELDPGMTPLEILDALCRGSRTAWRWLVIPEGYTVEEVAAAVAQSELGDAAEFLRLAQQPSAFQVEFPLPKGSLEGYLFPDTYRVDAGENERDIVAQMLRRFAQVVWDGLLGREPTYRGRTLPDILILASMVEEEARLEEERPIIAGVLLNRLQRGRRLECDATVQYALGDQRKSRLTHEDLTVESDYNTYLNLGLPPGPICSPGEASIRAAMEPATVPYLYYVARADGSHIFSKTFAEHEAAIARVRRGP